jgi:hypothetical protein
MLALLDERARRAKYARSARRASKTSKVCSLCSTSEQDEQDMLALLDEQAERAKEESSLIYRSSKHDFLINRVQFILSFDLLLQLLKLQTLVIK